MAVVNRRKQVWKERLNWVVSFLKAGIIGWVICFVAIGFLVASNVVIGSWNQQLNMKLQEVNSLSGDLNKLLVRRQKAADESKYDVVVMDMDRVARDTALFDTIAQESAEASFATRYEISGEIQRKYGNKVSENLANAIMTDAWRWGYNYRGYTPPEGSFISHYVSSQSWVQNFAADTYVYLGEILCRQSDAEGVWHDMRYVVTYSVDKDGVMSSVSTLRGQDD